jgi:ATP-dependent Lhr-like helicase
MSDSSSFLQLDERIQRYIWSEGWTELRDAQEMAIPFIVPADRDVIIAAATAAGKTEAAFLPALTHLLKSEPINGLIVYISPLKALINDQFGRLGKLCEDLDVPVWPWHGDISAGLKTKFRKNPKGVLLITPESVEALLCNQGTSVGSLFAEIVYFIVDELHAFIGSERGKQLQSLLYRIEHAIGRSVPRVGLSATLGDMRLAADFLRPGAGERVELVESRDAHAELRVLVKGYEEPAVVSQSAAKNNEDGESSEPTAPAQVCTDLFGVLRGSNNLVFPNSRREVERYTHNLSQMCAAERVPNEFWPHHGNLSKEIRAETEAALKQNERPATAICTNTLELGIDIGAVKSVAQIGPPPSVASLRQRLGRSGRRKGEPAILRGYCIEDEITSKSDIFSQLRLGTVQMAAMISLLSEKWFEPPVAEGAHLSTLVQQVLALIAQNGGASPAQLFKELVAPGAPFAGLSAEEFKELLRHLGKKGLLTQESSGLLLHGAVGEKLVNHYSFYAAFATEEEFRLVAGGRTLGSLPISQTLRAGQHILFAGRTWRVEEVNEQEKTIYVAKAKGGAPPLFSGGGGRVHTRVRQRMRELLASDSHVNFLDETGQQFLQEGRRAYTRFGLGERTILNQGTQALVLTWLGDSANEAIACLLSRRGMTAWIAGPGVEVFGKKHEMDDVVAALAGAAAEEPPPLSAMLDGATNLLREKWDWALPQPLLQKAYGSLYLNIEEALTWARATFGGKSRHRVQGGDDATLEKAGI